MSMYVKTSSSYVFINIKKKQVTEKCAKTKYFRRKYADKRNSEIELNIIKMCIT